MPTLLQINTVVNSGSTGRIAEDIGKTVMEAGWRSVIAYGRNPRPSTSETIRIGSDFGVKLHALHSRIFDDSGFGSVSATHKLIKEIEKLKPDVVLLHNIHGYYLNVEILFDYLSTAQVPVAWTLHDCWPITGHCSYFTAVGCDKWKTHCEKCRQLKEYPASLFCDASFKNFERKKYIFTSLQDLTLIPVSNWLRDILSESFLKSVPATVIHNGVNTTQFNMRSKEENYKTRKKHGISDKQFMILGCASVWNKRKGLEDFMTLRKCCGDDVAIVLVGLSKEQLKFLPNGIVGIERTDGIDELVALYSAADLFFNPTREDNLPTVNLEAQSCGTSVLTYDVGGCRETLAPESVYCEVLNIGKAIEAIERLKFQKARNRLCIRDFITKNFNSTNAYKKYLELFNTLLKENFGGRSATKNI